MNQYLIDKLKEGRLKKGLKQSDVTKLTGIKNTTLSNYENGNTEPDMDTFLKLCRLYELDYADLLGEAYGYHLPGVAIDIKKSDINLINKYRALDDSGRQHVDTVLQCEYDRIARLLAYAEKLANYQRANESAAKSSKVINTPEHLIANAAHDMGATPEQKANADRIMMDDDEWK